VPGRPPVAVFVVRGSKSACSKRPLTILDASQLFEIDPSSRAHDLKHPLHLFQELLLHVSAVVDDRSPEGPQDGWPQTQPGAAHRLTATRLLLTVHTRPACAKQVVSRSRQSPSATVVAFQSLWAGQRTHSTPVLELAILVRNKLIIVLIVVF